MKHKKKEIPIKIRAKYMLFNLINDFVLKMKHSFPQNITI